MTTNILFFAVSPVLADPTSLHNHHHCSYPHHLQEMTSMPKIGNTTSAGARIKERKKEKKEGKVRGFL
jgi:hypothetical protein